MLGYLSQTTEEQTFRGVLNKKMLSTEKEELKRDNISAI